MFTKKKDNNLDKKKSESEENTEPAGNSGGEEIKRSLSDYFLLTAAFFITAGEYISSVIVKISCAVWRVIKRFFLFLWDITNDIRKIFFSGVKAAGRKIAAPILSIIKFFRIMKKEIIRKRKKKGVLASVSIAVKYIMTFIFGQKGVVVTMINYAAPVISIFFLFSIVSYAASMEYAVKLSVNGVFYGYIKNEQVFTDAKAIVDERVSSLDSSIEINAQPSFAIEKIGYNEFLNQYQIADMVLQNANISIEYAYGFYINDLFFGALRDIEPVKQTLDSILNDYISSADAESVKFLDNIRYDEAGLYLTDTIIDQDWLISILTSMKSGSSYYEVVEGDTPLIIGEKLGMTLQQIEALNPGFTTENLLPGDKILKNNIIPFLSVEVTKIESYDEAVPYSTEYTEDSTMYEGTSVTVTDGENGINRVSARVSYVNGVATSTNILSTETVLQPVTEVIARGTKTAPLGAYSTETAPSGSFIWPVNGGYLSEWGYWDGGYSGHTGVDIAAPYGTAIFAGAAGQVVRADWNGGYGRCVIIQHDNGLRTLYAHCSALYVTVGQYVSQGECIAAVGQTGIATGNHCHFEVRYGSTRYNPKYYLNSIH